MLEIGLFQSERAHLTPTLKWERLALAIMAMGAVLGTFTPVFVPSLLNKPTKALLLGYGLFSSCAATATVALLKRKEKLNTQLDRAQEVALNQQLAHQLAFQQSVETIGAKRQLATLIEQLPPWERERWAKDFGLGGLLTPLPQPKPVEALPAAPLAIGGGAVASPDRGLVDTFVEPTDDALLKELANAYPEYVRIDDRWVRELIDSATQPNMGQRANHHLYLCGETQSGKSTLAGVLVAGIAARSETPAIVAGHDPKKEPGGTDITRWLCQFTYKVDGIANTDNWRSLADRLAQEQTQRASNAGGACQGVPELVLLQDEVDTIYGGGEGFGDRVSKDLAKSMKNFWVYGVKYLAGLRGHMVFMGQSPLSGDTGFKRPTLKSICFVAMGQTSAYILNNPKDFLNHINEEVMDVLRECCEMFERMGQRYALVRPTRGNPYVALIPEFDVDRVVGGQPQPQPQPTPKTTIDLNKSSTPDPVAEIEQWVQSLNRAPSDPELNQRWVELTGAMLNPKGLAMLREYLEGRSPGT